MLSLWDPFADFDRVRREFDMSSNAREGFVPAVDVEEQEKAYVLRAELPGIKREDVHVEVHDDVLTLKGERREDSASGNKKMQRIERRYGSFERRFSMPKHVDVKGIEAKLEHGVLELRLPKVPEVTPRRIEVSAV